MAFRLLHRPEGSSVTLLFRMMLLDYQCLYPLISGSSVSGTWLKLFSKKGSLSGKEQVPF